MKTIIYRLKKTFTQQVALLAILIVVASSCNSKLEEPIYDFWGEDFFSSTERLNLGVRGVAQSFSDIDTYGQNWTVFDSDTDISHVKDPGEGHLARDLGHYNIYASHQWLEKAWGLYYRAIDRANFILAHQEDVIIKNSDADKKRYKHLIAEVKALRALAYFDLVRLFGDVPYKDQYTVLGKDDMKYQRTDMEEIYEYICQDLNEAVVDLPWHDETGGEYVGRFTKGAGHALLARVYLFRGGWSLRQTGEIRRAAAYKDYYRSALEHADIVINSGKHALNPSYEDVFKNMCELKLEPKENIYEFQFFSASSQRGGSSTIGTYNGPSITQGSIFGRAISYIKTNMFFYNTFDDKDLRKKTAVATWQIRIRDGKEIYEEIASNSSYQWSPGKWRRDWHTSPAKDPNYTNVNWVFIRYSDVLLMKAEAENEINGAPTSKGVESINQVRRRAFGKDPSTANAEVDLKITNFNKDSFFEEIVAERARELCFEGHRRMDLIRWNRLGTALAETKKQFDDAIAAGQLRQYDYDGARKFVTLKHELYPIPSREILETGNTWEQNPGYQK